MNDTREFLKSINLPPGDNYNLISSKKRFSDGSLYKFEVPGIQNPKAMEALLLEINRLGLKIHRVTQTKGIMSLTDNEILDMVGLAKKHGVELVLAVGPRATTDTSATVNTVEGARMGYRLRGQEQIVRAVEDIKRAGRLGCRTFLIYDEGLLFVLDKAREKGEIDPDSHFKISAHCGHANPASANLLESIGANSINPVRDIQLQMLSSMREAIDIPIDVHTENPASTGGFIRHYEVPEMIRVAAPIYLKTGGSVAKTHSWDTSEQDAKARAKQVSLVQRMIDSYFPKEII